MKTYQKNNEFSYALGAFPTFELVKNRPDKTTSIIRHEKLTINESIEKLFALAESNSIPIETNSRLCEKLSPKENTFLIGVFSKYEMTLQKNENHIMLVNPSDMGNLGTILRAALGFGINNVAVIGEHADYFNPKTVRASMGSIFSMNIQVFNDFSDYAAIHKNFPYPFMLGAKTKLQQLNEANKPYVLIFGNESSGLPDSYLNIGTPIVIEHTQKIDSLNLPIAAALAMYHFDKISRY
ncbi:MAG TPA: TrmH family RNA methyltransferase [Eubacteriales bacterium]|nr:TrmH family RNA methyltransferase [Eubacteriales bacterium]